MINVTKTFLPPFEEYIGILKRAWDKEWITNNGELVQELEEKLKEYLGVPYLLFCGNGTVVLQMAIKAYNITGEVLTTPFSYVATTNAILWEGCKPIFVDINERNLGIDADKVEHFITDRTQAILATHVYGYPLDVEKIESVAKKHNLKVIYDGAHAFGCIFKNRSLLNYGDISTCSFHATKLFHTVEGGCVICHDEETYRKLFLYRQFGHIYDDYLSVGINGKNSEFHAAMGLCVLPKMPDIIKSRKETCTQYRSLLDNKIVSLTVNEKLEYNYSYFPIIFSSEEILLKVMANLKKEDISCRRYFYPSLNMLDYLSYQPCPISESISKRVICLPLYYGISTALIQKICRIVNLVI